VSSDWEAIRRVVAAFDQSDWSEIDVRWRDVRVQLATRADTGAQPATPTSAHAVPTAAPAPAPGAGTGHGVEPGAASLGRPSLPAGAHVVASPSPGIFWRAPEPGAPPFVEIGDTVDPSMTLCIIEVMKLMSHLKADVTGDVVAIYGTDGFAVVKGEPLVAIVPSEMAP